MRSSVPKWGYRTPKNLEKSLPGSTHKVVVLVYKI